MSENPGPQRPGRAQQSFVGLEVDRKSPGPVPINHGVLLCLLLRCNLLKSNFVGVRETFRQTDV